MEPIQNTFGAVQWSSQIFQAQSLLFSGKARFVLNSVFDQTVRKVQGDASNDVIFGGNTWDTPQSTNV